jgi:hypothetical protein
MEFNKVDTLGLAKQYKGIENKNIYLVIENYFVNYGLFGIGVNSTIVEVATALEWDKTFAHLYKTKKENAPNWKTALHNWIFNINDKLSSWFDNDGYILWTLTGRIYNDICNGDVKHVHEYANQLVFEQNDESLGRYYAFNPECLFEIKNAFLYAYKLSELKKELALLNENTTPEPQPINITKNKTDYRIVHNLQFANFIDFIQQNYNLEIGFDTTVLDLAKLLDFEKKFEEDYNNKKSIAPNWAFALSIWIENINSMVITELKMDSPRTLVITKIIYEEFLEGENHKLVDLLNFISDTYLVDEDGIVDVEKYHFEMVYIEAIINGVQYAYYLEKLKKELALLENQTNETSEPNNMINETQKLKSIQPIKWQKDKILLAYLFNELKNKGIIEDKNVWQKLSTFFVDADSKPISNKDFTAMVTNYSKNKTKVGKKSVPTEHKEITDLLNIINDVTNQLEPKK